ncbi:MAG: MFS transporter, partial [Gammaproteobacteria bacterium]|nr:MFS transporter [Gammaproteobacteria bacterium]
PGSELTQKDFLEIFKAQMCSRHIDLVAREMRARNEGFYTIGSPGHEGNAVIGQLSRTTDPAFLHYRSGGFMMARGFKDADTDPVFDTALSLAASSEDPISGGRHKVWGSRKLWVPPQTSTIASHLSKAVGTALAIEQGKRIGIDLPVPDDSIVICSFGDASANHSAAAGAFNAALWSAFQNLPVPVVFVCEDNGLGISVKTPAGWIESNFSTRTNLAYFKADGLDIVDTWNVARDAIEMCRRKRVPVFLHLRVKRLLGHAGTDVETEYLNLAEVESAEACDPLLVTAETALEAGLMSAAEIRDEYESVRTKVRDAAAKASKRPRLTTAAQVMAPLGPFDEKAVAKEAGRTADTIARSKIFGGAERLPELSDARHMSIQINRALHDLLIKYPEATLFGEDVAQKGGVYTVTTGLARAFKGARVFNTLLDETTILGLAQGAGLMGLLPFPEIQYLAYFHNACDQLRGEACSLQYFSDNQFANPMVVRIASLGYQKGFGGHFHNDNSFTALRDIPGLVIACPSRGDDAAMMLRTSAALAKTCGRVVAFLEPIALYMNKDLHEPKDGEWLFEYPAPEKFVPVGEPRIYSPEATDLLIITFGNGVPMALRTARALKQSRNKKVRVMDLRWLKPLNKAAIAEHARACDKTLVLDEGRRTGGISEEIFTALDEARVEKPKARVTGEDTYIPLAAAANLVLPSDEQALSAAEKLLSEGA